RPLRGVAHHPPEQADHRRHRLRVDVATSGAAPRPGRPMEPDRAGLLFSGPVCPRGCNGNQPVSWGDSKVRFAGTLLSVDNFHIWTARFRLMGGSTCDAFSAAPSLGGTPGSPQP